MTEINEEEQNIDDLVDYNDFDSKNLESLNDIDSFNDDIVKFYEDHKKNVGTKTNEITNNQRPVSSYQRVMLSKANEEPLEQEDDYDDFNFEDNVSIKDEELINDNINDNINNLNYDLVDKSRNDKTSNKPSNDKNTFTYDEEDLIKLIKKFNKFLINQNITQNDFCDNLNLYLNFSDFKDLFKKLKFDIKSKDARILFVHNNPYYDQNYICIKNFFDSYKFEFKYEMELEKINTDYDIKKINKEFKNLHDEILEIVRNDVINDEKKRKGLKSANFSKINPIYKFNLENKNKINSSNTNNNLIDSNNSSVNKNKFTFNNNNMTHSINNVLSLSNNSQMNIKNDFDVNFNKNKNLKSLNINKILKENFKKQKEEEVIMRQNFDKREKEFIKECKKKMIEANKICQEMGITRQYSAIKDSDGNVRCFAIESDQPKDENNPRKMELKAFIVEWRILTKSLIQKNQEMRFSKMMSGSMSPNNTLDKKEIQKQIKKVLINTIRLKMKLKEQVETLKQNYIIDEKDILEHLKFTNV